MSALRFIIDVVAYKIASPFWSIRLNRQGRKKGRKGRMEGKLMDLADGRIHGQGSRF